MTTSQLHVTDQTQPGATPVDGGTVFRVWAPQALAVYIAIGHPRTLPSEKFERTDDKLLVRRGDDWAGFLPGVTDGDLYRFYVVGTGSVGFKRDPYARELEIDGYPDCNCIVRNPRDYPWHDAGFRPPAFNDLIVYQFHIGVFFAEDAQGRDLRPGTVRKILDVVDRIPYFADLGINAVMPLPFQEFQGENSLGYNGTDLFSPEMDYAVRPEAIAPYLDKVNRLLQARGAAPIGAAQLTGQANQFKAFIDLCHLHGIAVITDVVYNHGGGSFDDQSIEFFDRQPQTNDNNSQYFTSQDLAGGRVFAFWKREVRQFLIDNGKALLGEYHVDGLRYDEVTVIARSGGWNFAQDLTSTLRFVKPEAVQIAEFWDEPGSRWKSVATPPNGMGFDLGYGDALRKAVRAAIASAAHGRDAPVDLGAVKDALQLTYRDGARWTVFQGLENHDLLYVDHDDKEPRVARLADPSNPRSWFARSRARVAMALLLTAPGVPMLFMGQEILEDKYWSDWPGHPDLLIWWKGLEGADKDMSDFHRFTRDILWLRRRLPALRADGLNVFHIDNAARVIAFHRWLPGIGRDVVVVASLNETTLDQYRIGFPTGGHWDEAFNSDVYDRWFNPVAHGNFGGVTADGPAWDGLPTSATVTLPANGVVVFVRSGD